MHIAPLQKPPDWIPGEGDVLIENTRLGVQVRHVEIQDDEGKALWDQVIIDERPGGAISVPINEKGEIGVIENYRVVMARDENVAFPLADYSELGLYSTEFPRGFPLTDEVADDAVARETQEELGHPVISSVLIGRSNLNTAFYVRTIPIYLTRVDTTRARELAPDLNERIRKVKWVTSEKLRQMVADGVITCGATLAAYALYLARD